MATELEQARRTAQSYMTLAQRVRGVIWNAHGTDRVEQLRADWPELAEALDALLERVDRDRPPDGVPRGLFQQTKDMGPL